MNIDPTPITNWLALFLALAAVITLFARWIQKGAKRRELNAQHQRDEMIELIKQVTLPIQRGTNGGLSLTDLHHKVDVLVDRQEQVVSDVALLKSAVLQLEDDVDGMR